MAEPVNAEQPNALPGKTVTEIRTAYGDAQARILNDLSLLAAAAAAVDISMRANELEALGLLTEEEQSHVALAIQERWAAEKRAELKTRYIELDVERAEAVAERVEALEDYLEPESVEASAFLQAFQMDEQALTAAFDGAAALESEGAEDVVKLLFKVARERELDMLITHALDVRPDLEQAYAEVMEAADNPDRLDPADLFETLADAAPSKDKILSAGTHPVASDQDAVARMLG